jgi:acetyltransferase-like isoleucine patch superfamily enzyme
MLKFLREFSRAMRHRENRYQLLYAMVCEVPDQYGMILRSALMARLFASAGDNVQVLEGVRIRNPGMIRCGRNLGLGNDVILQAGGGIEFGDDVLLGPGVKIWTQNHRSDDIDTPIREQGYHYKSVSVGDDCWIGANAFIMPGVRLPRGCVVAAGSVVGVKAYKEYSILGGSPARLIGFRNAARVGTPSDPRPDDEGPPP